MEKGYGSGPSLIVCVCVRYDLCPPGGAPVSQIDNLSAAPLSDKHHPSKKTLQYAPPKILPKQERNALSHLPPP